MQISVLEYLERGALQSCPDGTALVDGHERLTFRELDRLAKACASRILQIAVGRCGPVAVFLPKSAAVVIADLGILYSGNYYTNVDVKSPVQRLRTLFAHLRPGLIITRRDLQDDVLALGAEPERIVCLESLVQSPLPCDDANLPGRPALIDTDPVCIINTSGSTGIPKSVVLNHRSTIDFIDWVLERFQFEAGDVIGSLSPFHFDIYTLELYVALARGCTLHLIPERMAAFPAQLVQHLAQQCVTFIFWVPTIMVTIANMDLLSPVNLSGLRQIFFAGEVFPNKQLNYWRRKLPQALFVNLYGPIEISVDCTYFVVDREFSDDEPLPIGRPCRNTDILILNEQDQPAGVNEPGELCVRGGSLALGYWNNPEQTAKAFTQNPLNPHYPEVIYRTGDSVFRNERGEIMFIGRKDFQVKHLGYRIELGEIETAASALPEINHACVLYHQARKEITLFFEARERLTPAHIRQRLGERLPKYMLPTVFHQVDSLPTNPNGKIDRQLLIQTHMMST